ncbi:DEAD/DEAH box helicase family protein [Gelidibacter maritimus]|uniref:DEAD/DEAH box helicase family protein n=1 Tax=Gelidibacter maritimus TaxID=2761487 RepID=A0A7W2M2D0_9FLAO|nr:DEAD/DEAH box helicase family protein [Gelidibacter maritimus]MBA6151449.1 DEAD/DEAH box helicase family protein [Gelidibacter maritimus]
MTAFQKHWNSEIEILLKELGTPKSLEDNIIDTLNHSRRTGIFPNQIINALRLGQSIKDGNQNMAFVASMQSGKSGTIYFLCNYVLPALGILSEYESILFVTSMRDTDLYDQNCRNLQAEFYDCVLGEMRPSNIKVMKMSDFFNHPNPHKVVNEFDVQLIVRDEDQFGCGEDSSFQAAFFSELRRRIPDIKLLAVSATPYDILDAQFSGDADVDVIVGVRPPDYYGISEMLEDNIIEDLPEAFKPLQAQGSGEDIVYNVHPKVIEYANHLVSFENGLGIIRESNTLRALELRKQLKSQYKRTCTVIAIGSDTACDFNINDGIKEISSLVLKRGQRVILIVVQALTAGKDLGMLKEKVRFGIETRDSQLANGAQGITGRFCGYHKNRDFKLLASVNLLSHYAQFEQDYEIFSDREWRNELYNNDVKGLSTHTRFVNTQRQGVFTPIVAIETIDYCDLLSQEARDLLDFIDDDGYHRLLGFFDTTFYDSHTKGTRFGQKGVTVRIASGYNLSSNRVYKNWNCGLESDFGSVFFKKQQYEFGLLISNYPVDDVRNTLGFCGIKILVSGEREFRNQETDVLNGSMYSQSSETE